MRLFLFSFLLICTGTVSTSAFTFTKTCLGSFSSSIHTEKIQTVRLCSSKSPDPSDIERMLDSASKLRKELVDLQDKLDRTATSEKTQVAYTKPAICTSLPDSQWILTYRFASEPPPKDNDERDTVKRKYYSGRVSLRLSPDGYTDLIQHEPTGSPSIDFEKFWGWDLEESSEDKLNYLNWAATIQLPESDPNNPKEAMRFYMQARVDVDSSTKAISLADGTVTVKKDIEPPGGFWGVFNGGGILAQFRYVGNFVGKTRST